MPAMSDYLIGKLLGHVFQSVNYDPPLTIYLALFTDAGALTEVTGGSYARQELDFSNPPVSGLITNSAGCTFTNMPDCTLLSVALMDAVVDGNVLVWDSIASRTVVSGTNLTVAIGDMAVSFA